MITLDEAIEYCEELKSAVCAVEREHHIVKVWKQSAPTTSVLEKVIECLKDYRTLKSERPRKITKLYAIEDISTGKIIFNARGGAYKTYEECMAKLDKLPEGKYKIVTYELRE
jgi:hypothetical protein